jgi:hypothetical protein
VIVGQLDAKGDSALRCAAVKSVQAGLVSVTGAALAGATPTVGRNTDLPPVEGSAAKQKVPPTPNTLTTRAAFNRRKQVTRVGVAGRCKKVIG